MKRDPELRAFTELTPEEEAVIFAGAGGTCEGMKKALKRSPFIAVNHDEDAIACHAENHPDTIHYCEDVADVDPVVAMRGRRCGALWLSPDCTYHSKARGGKPFRDRDRAERIRGLPGEAQRWARAVRPRVIFVENVEELQDWGPLGDDGRPDPTRRGDSFRKWVAELRNLGYTVEWRELRACDYGSPTSRKRLFVIARCDGRPIVWPKPTHGPGRALPYRTAAECIDWDEPAPSIFLTPVEAKAWGKAHGVGTPKRPLSDKTMARIARGIFRYVINAREPFIVPVTHGGGENRCYPTSEPMKTITGAHRGEFALVAPTLIQTSYGEREGQAPRSLDIHAPLGTIVAGGGKHALVAAFLARHYGGHENDGQSPTLPFSTVTTQDHHAAVAAHLVKLRGTSTAASVEAPAPTLTAGGTHLAEVRAFLLRYNGTSKEQSLRLPLTTVDTTDRFGLVMVHGVPHMIVDITMRMLKVRELGRAHSFPSTYRFDRAGDRVFTQATQTKFIGNSVPVDVAAALVGANYAPEAA
jgi:DNA (cytosine-5)-methyltransferase 1